MEQPGLEQVIVAGGTGLVGRALVEALAAQGSRVTVLSRRPDAPGDPHLPEGTAVHSWEDLPGLMDGASAVINLAGESIAGGRWSRTRKAAILDSRVGSTARLVGAMRACAHPPQALVNASAVGWYGPRDAAPVDERAEPGADFLAEVCQAWEAEAREAEPLGVRVVLPRLGVVLAREGGALPRIALPLRFFLGSALGSGRQGLSWIHRDDLVALLVEAARNPGWSGPVNATAPEPLASEAFTQRLARRLHRPLLPLPDSLTTAALKVLLGEMADTLLLHGAFVLPARAQGLGFHFRFPTLDAALADLFP